MGTNTLEEQLPPIYQTTRHHLPEDCYLKYLLTTLEDLKSPMRSFVLGVRVIDVSLIPSHTCCYSDLCWCV